MLAENLRMRFNERTIATQQRVKDLMDQSGRETWNCDQEPNEYRYKGWLFVNLKKKQFQIMATNIGKTNVFRCQQSSNEIASRICRQ